MARQYTSEELKKQDPNKWTDAYIKEWGGRSGKVVGVAKSDAADTEVVDITKGKNDAADTRGQSTFRLSSSMTEVGNVGVGRTGSIGRVSPTVAGSLLLYDDLTGKVYQTSEWKDADKNKNYLINSVGDRQRIVGYASSGEGNAFSVHNKAKPGTQWLIAGYDEKIPAAGTQEFQDYVSKKFEDSAISQASGNRITVGPDGEVSKPSTDLGQFATISAEDYIRLGKPGSLGNFKLPEYSGMSDEELRKLGGLMLRDTKNRSHGIESALNKVGGVFGDDNFGFEFMRVANDIGKVPLLGTPVGIYTKPISAYEEARDAGESSGSAMHSSGKAYLSASVDTAISAAKVAAAVAVTVATGGAGAPVGVAILAGAAAGAATEAAGTAASYGVNRSIYGTGNRMYGHGGRVMGGSRELWDSVGKSAAVGAVTGAVGAGVGSSLSAYGSGLSNITHKTLSGIARGSANYVVQRYGLGAKDDAYLWANVVGTALTPDTTYDYSSAIRANPFLASKPGSSWISSAVRAFREQASTSNYLSGLFDKGSETNRFLSTLAARGYKDPKTGDQKFLPTGFDNKITPESAFTRQDALRGFAWNAMGVKVAKYDYDPPTTLVASGK